MVRILLSLNDADVREMYAFALSVRGFAVDEVPGAAAALARLDASSYDVVVLDGGSRGVATIDAVRSVAADSSVVVLSTYATAADRQASLEAGADDYLASPVDLNELADRLRATAGPVAA